jgi:hypothetical protein
MAFEFDKNTLSAFDPKKNVRIRRSGKFYDIADEFFYIYEGPNANFEFCIVERREFRKVVIKGIPTERKIQVASFIVESSLKAGLAKTTKGQPPDGDAYEAIKSDVSKGLFVVLTWGGDLLSWVPDYRIEFA